MENQTFEIPGSLLGELMNYLAAKPYREVAGAMQALQGLKPLTQSPTSTAQ